MHRYPVHGRCALFGAACSVALITALAGPAAAADDTRLEPTAHQNVKRMYSPAPAGAATSGTATTSGGMVVYLDEQGRPTQEPSGRTRDAVQIPALNQSHEGLVAKTTTTKEGFQVRTLDLQGRFQSYAVGTVGPDGKVKTGCIAPGDVKVHGKDAGTSSCQGTCCK